MDARVEVDAAAESGIDAGSDAQQASPCPKLPEEIVGNDVDDDCDGLVDEWPADISAALHMRPALWEECGAMIEIMDPAHHDLVLGITSHLPHLIAYTIVGTATELEDDIKSEVIKFSASGFRDFTRIAASDPVMWRDIFLNNKAAVLEVLQRFSEDLTALQKAIRQGNGDYLYDVFTKTRAIRKQIVQIGQAE